MVYKSLSRPVWSYAIQIRCNAKPSQIRTIQTFQSIQALHFVIPAPRYISTHRYTSQRFKNRNNTAISYRALLWISLKTNNTSKSYNFLSLLRKSLPMHKRRRDLFQMSRSFQKQHKSWNWYFTKTTNNLINPETKFFFSLTYLFINFMGLG